MKRIYLIFTLFCTVLGMAAQQKTAPTLEDLMWGGNNYWNHQPTSLETQWWGNKTVKLTHKDVSLLDGKTLFTADDVNALLKDDKITSLIKWQNIDFPDEKRPVAFIKAPKTRLLYNWKTKEIEWQTSRNDSWQAEDFNLLTRRTAYVENHQLFVKNADGNVVQLTTDGSREIVYGQAVHRDEWGINGGLFWSPKGDKLAFYRMDQTMVTDFPLVNIDHRVAQAAPEKYPMAGMTIHRVIIGVYDVQTQKTVWLDTPKATLDSIDSENPVYFANISWSPDGQTLYVNELPRTQNKAEFTAYDAADGQRKGVIYTEQHEKYVNPKNGIVFVPWDNGKVIIQSEKDGFNHLYYGTLGEKITDLKDLTPGKFVVTKFLGFNVKEKSAVYVSTEKGDLRETLFKVSLVTGERTSLDNGIGVHSPFLSPDGHYIIDRWSAPEIWRQYDKIDVAKVKRTTLQTDDNPWTKFTMPQVESGTLKAADDSTTLYWRLVKPVDFDETKKYPTVVYVYGGPGLRNVDERWNYCTRQWEYFMANKGFIVFVLDNRGSKFRGRDFENCTFRHLGEEEMADQMRGVDYLKTLPYVDADRLGVHGWSFGGFMTTNLMLTYPDVFKVGVAGGPVIDWKFYEAMYGERYMDSPQENPEGYEHSSLLGKAQNLKGRLQIIVGYNDPVCVLQHSLSFLRKCEDVGTQPDYFVYPGQGHNMEKHDAVHLHERITRYFEDFLK